MATNLVGIHAVTIKNTFCYNYVSNFSEMNQNVVLNTNAVRIPVKNKAVNYTDSLSPLIGPKDVDIRNTNLKTKMKINCRNTV